MVRDPIGGALLGLIALVLRFGNITTMAWWDNLYLNEGTFELVFSINDLL